MVLAAYGGKCVCCGETEEAFLCIDHVNDDGAQHRMEIGQSIYKWIVQNGYPSIVQILCANCNMAKSRPGGCPHKVTAV